MSYSTFLAQVETKNLLRVYIQGDKLIGVLVHPFVGLDVIATPGDTYSPFALATSSVESPFTIYTRLPARADATLLPLLLGKGVVIITSPIASPPGWVLVLEKFAPLLLAFFTLLLIMKPPPWKDLFPSDTSIDNKITQIAECRIHRLERVQEHSKAHSESAVFIYQGALVNYEAAHHIVRNVAGAPNNPINAGVVFYTYNKPFVGLFWCS